MDRIKNKVTSLNNNAWSKDDDNTKKETAIRILQGIGRDLVANYRIIIGDIVVEPLWVEAYYYLGKNKKEDDNNGYDNASFFVDPFVHCSAEQIGEENFGKLYFQRKSDDQRSGVDICLPINDDFYLSFLLKYTLVDGEYTTQSQLSGKIRARYEEWKQNNINKKPILVYEPDTKESIITCTSRFFPKLKEDDKNYLPKTKFYNNELAIVKILKNRYDIKFKETGRKEELVKAYLEKEYSKKEERAIYCKEYLGYVIKDFK